ncbi:MAG: DUF4336 domain-containing protein [Betaproteobacteria bacterium]
MLLPITDKLWHVEHTFRVNGLPTTTRMTVIRLPGSQLLLHSPIPLDDSLARQIDALGSVGFIVAPSKTQHLFLAPCQARYPQAIAFGVPGLIEKRADIQGLRELPQHGVADWSPDLEYLIFGGIPFGNESLWFHRPSATLIATDLVQWWRGKLPLSAALYARLTGVRKRLAVPLTVRALVRDRDAAKRSAQAILAWPFSRVVMAHNTVVDQDAHASMQQALSYFIRGEAGDTVRLISARKADAYERKQDREIQD